MMINDGVFVHEAIIPSGEELSVKKKCKKEGEVINVDRPPEKQLSIDVGTFNKAYEQMMKNYRDPGTQFMFKT